MKQSLSRWVSIIHLLGLVLVFGVKAFGQSSLELSCKAQAKEVAVQTYNGCVTEARQQQIDSLRKEYQVKLSELKDHYNKELKKAAGKESEAETAAPAPKDEAVIQLKPAKKISGKSIRGEKPVKGVAKVLPKKMQSTGAALPVQNVSDDLKVVPSAEPSPEVEAAQMDSDSQSSDNVGTY